MEAFKIFGTIEVQDSDAAKKLDNISKKAKEVSDKLGKATDSVQKQIANFGKGFDVVGKTFSGIGKGFESVGKTISTAVTAPLVAVGTATAKTAIEFLSLKEQTKTAFQVLLGSGEKAEKMLKDLHVFAKTTPFSYQTYLQAGKTLVAMGVAAEDCIPYLDGITNAAIATGVGQQGIDRISQALGRMQSSGKVTLETLNILTYSGIPAVKILANQYGVTTEEMFKMISKSEILADVALPKLIKGMNEGTNGAAGMTAAYGGLAKEMKGTLMGAFDKLRSKFRDMSVDLWNAEDAYPHLTKAIEEFTGSLDVLPKIFESVSRAAVPALKKVTEGLQKLKKYLDTLSPEQLKQIGDIILKIAVAGPALMIVGKAFKIIGGLSSGVGKTLTLLAPALANISKFKFATLSTNITKLGKGFLNLLNPVSAVKGLFAGLQPVTNLLAQKISILAITFSLNGGGLSGAIAVLQGVLGGAVGAFGSFLAAIAPVAGAIAVVIGVIKVLKDNWDKVTAVFKNFTDNIKLSEKFESIKESALKLWDKLKGLGDLFTVIGTVVLTTLQPSLTVLAGLFDAAVSAISPLLDAIGGLVDGLAGLGEFLLGVFTGDWEKAWNGIKKSGQGTIDFIGGLWKALDSLIVGLCDGVIGYVKGLFDGLNITQLLSDVWETMKRWFTDTCPKICDKLGEWGKAIVKWFEELPTKTKEKLEEWKKAIEKWFIEKKDTIVEGLKEWWNNAVNWFNQTPFAQAFETIKTEAGKVMEDPDYLITLIDGWTEGLTEWSEKKFQQICDEFDAWGVGISNWFTEKKDTIVNGFNEWWNNTTTWFTEKKTTITTKFEEWGTSISTWFSEKKDTLVNGFNEWWDNTTTWLSELPTKITTKFEEWKTSVSNWFTEKSDTITKGFTEWWENTSTWFTNLPTTITTEFDKMKTSVGTWFTEKKDTLVEGFTEWLNGVKDWFTGDNQEVQSTSQGVVESVVAGVEEKTKEPHFILRLGQSILKLLLAAVAAVGVALLGVGWAIVDWILQGITKGWESLKTNVSTKVKELGTKIGQKWEDLKTTTSTKWESIKSTVSTKASEIKESAGEKIKTLVSNASKSWESLKSTASEKWSSIKSTVSEKADQIKQKAISAFQSIDSQSGGKLSSLVSKVSTKFGEIKDKIADKMESAKRKVSDMIEKIKGLFNFKWSLPALKAPQFKISPPGWKIGDLLRGSIPHLSVAWHAKAMDKGMILNEPTIFGMDKSGTLLGGGEAGSETIVGTQSLMDMVQNATHTNNKYIAELLEKILMYLQSSMSELSNRQVVLDTGVLAGELTPSINARLGLISEAQARGRS